MGITRVYHDLSLSRVHLNASTGEVLVEFTLLLLFPHLIHEPFFSAAAVNTKFFHGFKLDIWVLGEREKVLAHRLTCLETFLFSFPNGFMVLKLLFAANTSEITSKLETRAFYAFV